MRSQVRALLGVCATIFSLFSFGELGSISSPNPPRVLPVLAGDRVARPREAGASPTPVQRRSESRRLVRHSRRLQYGSVARGTGAPGGAPHSRGAVGSPPPATARRAKIAGIQSATSQRRRFRCHRAGRFDGGLSHRRAALSSAGSKCRKSRQPRRASTQRPG
jgi:hypothetical protein